METPFRALSFVNHEVITRDKMDQLQADYQWINDNTPRGRLYRDGGVLDYQLMLVAGKSLIRRNRKRDDQKVGVRFAKAFHPNCRPNVTTGVVADFQRQIFCTVHGPKGVNYPNYTGFEISVNIAADNKKQDVIKKNFYVHWSAMGYRKADMNDF